MGAVYDECVADLERWRREYEGRPHDEMVRLWLLALERESIVSVTYREDLLRHRLQKLPVSDELREVFTHALLWAWKDEEMHAVYIRGALFRGAGLWQRAKILSQQASGLIGGWASAVQQNLLWREAPLSRALSAVITALGGLLGKVSDAVRGQLRYHSFQEFCAFNVDAERTAVLVWGRLVELVRADPLALRAADFSLMKEDEERHAKLFALFADALTPEDHLKPCITAASLRDELRGLSEFFLPPRYRAHGVIGRGGAVYVTRAALPEKREAFRRFLAQSSLDDVILATPIASQTGQLSSIKVAIKVSFMMGYHRDDLTPLTDPALLALLCEHLNDLGITDISVLETTNHLDHFFAGRSVEEVAAYFSYDSTRYRLVDASAEQTPHQYHRGMGQYTISRTWRDADLRVSFGTLRSHPTDMAHLTMRNLEGLSARSEQFLFSERQAHFDTALMTLLQDFPPHFALLDAFEHVADGVAGILGSPRPLHPGRFYASQDAFSLDVVAMRHTGIKQPLETVTLQEARQWFGDPRAALRVVGEDSPIEGFRSPHSSGPATLLSMMADTVYSTLSGRGSLFVPAMDEAAFPAKQRQSAPRRVTRRVLRRLLGLRPR